MKVRRERFDESVVGDRPESRDAHYVGTTYVFTLEDGEEAVVRAYDDEPGFATLIRPTAWYAGWLEAPAVRPMVAALREAGIEHLRLYNRLAGHYADEVLLGRDPTEGRAG